MKAKRYLKKKSKKKIYVIILLICLLVVLKWRNSNKTNETYEANTIHTSHESQEQEENKEVEYIKAPYEDEEIVDFIDDTILENNLNEEKFAFFYYNIDNDSYYFYNEDKWFIAASTVKVPIAMMYYDKINSGELQKESKLLYSKGCYEAGDGYTSYNYSVGQYIPISYLLKQSIVYSDNTAVNILIKSVGQSKYRYNIANYYNKDLPQEFYSSNIISASYGYEIMNYIYNNSSNYQELIEFMKSSSYGKYLKKYIESCEVAHKYGSYNGYVHDYGIIYSDDVYLIGIFTKNVSNAEELIANISLEIFNYVNKK